MFIDEFEKGNVYVSKKHSSKIFEFMESGDDKAIQKLIDERQGREIRKKGFQKSFAKDLKDDLETLNTIKTLWQRVEEIQSWQHLSSSFLKILYCLKINSSSSQNQKRPPNIFQKI